MKNLQKYHILSRIIHWLMALIIISLLAIGIYMTDFIPKDASYRGTIYGLHKSFGVLVILLFFIRIINRLINKAPKLPNSLPNWQKFIAKVTHFKLYILMFLMPISGYLMSNSYGYAVNLFGLRMPFLIEKNYESGAFFSYCHKYLGYIFIALITLHIMAVIRHRFFDKTENNILSRML
jgi:cytochrome b561